MKAQFIITMITLLLLVSCDSSGQSKAKTGTKPTNETRVKRFKDSLNQVQLKEIMKDDAFLNKVNGTWIFKQTQTCNLGNCLFNDIGANGVCDKMKLIINYKIDTLNGISYSSKQFTFYYIRLGTKDGIIVNDREIGSGEGCIKQGGTFQLRDTKDKKHKVIDCKTYMDAFYNDCTYWDEVKGAFYSNYTLLICQNPCNISGYWEREIQGK